MPVARAFRAWNLIKPAESISPAWIQALGYQHYANGRGICCRFFALMEITPVALFAVNLIAALAPSIPGCGVSPYHDDRIAIPGTDGTKRVRCCSQRFCARFLAGFFGFSGGRDLRSLRAEPL
jgi:hypothetical protein